MTSFRAFSRLFGGLYILFAPILNTEHKSVKLIVLNPRPRFLNCGVQHRTILGPLYSYSIKLTIYRSDMIFLILECIYADDTSITYAGKDVKEINDFLNKYLKSINTW